MTPRARRILAATAVLAPLAGLALGVRACREGPPRPPDAAIPAPTPVLVAEAPRPPASLEVLSVSGAVDAGDGAGAWRPLLVGEVLRADGLVRTGPGARAELAAGPSSRLTVDERTQVGVRELSAAVHRFRLTRGLIRVDYAPDGDRVVRVEESSGGAVAEARAAHFHVAANGLTFAVASETGTVSLSAAGATVDVGAGESSVAPAGAPPSAPRAIPTELLLKVAEASRLGEAGRCLDATGRSEPGALATVNGEPVEVDAAGRFPIRAARRRGAGLADGVEVRVVAPDGRVITRTLPCWTEPDARIRDLRVRWKRGDP